MALRASAAPPTAAELKPYLEFLVGHKLYDLAYYTWLQFLPPEELHHAGLLFNSKFEVLPSGMPFDWVISSGSGVTIDVVPRPDNESEHALRIDFEYGRVDYRGVTQLVMLTPGTYSFQGKYEGQFVGPRGLKWRIVCAGNETMPLGESVMMTGTGSTWRDVGFKFTVPSTNCRAQYIRLDLDARMASEQLVAGSMFFGDLRLSRSPTQSIDASRAD